MISVNVERFLKLCAPDDDEMNQSNPIINRRKRRRNAEKSVTAEIYFRCFFVDQNAVITDILQSKRILDPKDKYFNCRTAIDIHRIWMADRQKQVQLHEWINKSLVNNQKLFEPFCHFKQHYIDAAGLKMVYVDREFNCDGVVGRIDALFVTPKGKFVLFEWKYGLDDSITKPVEKADEPFQEFDNTPSMKFVAQVALLARLLQKCGYPIVAAFLVRFDDFNYHVVHVDQNDKQLSKAVEAVFV